jgi:hypothetical protein
MVFSRRLIIRRLAPLLRQTFYAATHREFDLACVKTPLNYATVSRGPDRQFHAALMWGPTVHLGAHGRAEVAISSTQQFR